MYLEKRITLTGDWRSIVQKLKHSRRRTCLLTVDWLINCWYVRYNIKPLALRFMIIRFESGLSWLTTQNIVTTAPWTREVAWSLALETRSRLFVNEVSHSLHGGNPVLIVPFCSWRSENNQYSYLWHKNCPIPIMQNFHTLFSYRLYCIYVSTCGKQSLLKKQPCVRSFLIFCHFLAKNYNNHIIIWKFHSQFYVVYFM